MLKKLLAFALILALLVLAVACTPQDEEEIPGGDLPGVGDGDNEPAGPTDVPSDPGENEAPDGDKPGEDNPTDNPSGDTDGDNTDKPTDNPEGNTPSDDPTDNPDGDTTDDPPAPPVIDPDDKDDIGGSENDDGSFDLPGVPVE